MAAILGGMLGEGEERRENMKTITIIVVLFCFGCASTGTGNQKIMNGDFQGKIEAKKSTRTDILGLLGEPSKKEHYIIEGFKIEAWFYEGTDRVIPALCYVPLIDLTQKQTVRAKMVIICFDDGGHVVNVVVDAKDEKRMFAAGTVSLIFAGLGAVAGAGSTAYAPYTAGGHSYPGKAVINTTPTTGGGNVSTIKYYR